MTIALSGAMVADLDGQREQLEARMKAVDEELAEMPEDSRAHQMLLFDRASLLCELVRVRAAIISRELAGIRLRKPV